MYRGIALALGLFVTPAAAETYDRHECQLIEKMLNNCTVKSDCEPVNPAGLGKAVIWLADRHPKWSIDKFHGICHQVCDGKSTTLDALYKYCPWRRHDLIREDRAPYD
jgi:hypothetical protein